MIFGRIRRDNMELTRERAIELFREEWNYIADEIEERKEHCNIVALKRKYCSMVMERAKHSCFLCEYSLKEDGFPDCSKCPIDWGSKRKGYMCEDKKQTGDRKGLYMACYEEKDWKKQAELARKIANLPEREVSND